MLIVGFAIRADTDSKYANKMYHHTPESRSYEFEDVFAEGKIGDRIKLLSIIPGVAGALWLVVAAINRNQSQRP